MSKKAPAKAGIACIGLMLKAVEELEVDCTTPLEQAEEVTMKQLTGFSKRLSHEATKFIVFLSSDPDNEAVAAPAEAISNSATAVVSLLRGAMVGASVTLRQRMERMCKKVITSLRSLLEQSRAQLEVGAKLEAAQKTGVLWQCLKELETVPITNRAAVAERLLRSVSCIQDAQSELEEIQQRDDSSDAASAGAEEADDLFADDVDLTAEEMRVVPAVQTAAKTAATVLTKLSAYLRKSKDEGRSPEGAEWLETQLSDAQAVVETVDLLGEAVYSPQDVKVLHEAGQELVRRLTTMLTRLEQRQEFIELFPSLGKKKKKKKKKKAAASASTTAASSASASKNEEPAAAAAAAKVEETVAASIKEKEVLCVCGLTQSETALASEKSAGGLGGAALWLLMARRALHNAHSGVEAQLALYNK